MIDECSLCDVNINRDQPVASVSKYIIRGTILRVNVTGAWNSKYTVMINK